MERPVIVYFQDYNEKTSSPAELKKKLRGSNIFKENNNSNSTLKKRKLLWERAWREQASGRNAYLSNDNLLIDSDTFVWDDVKHERVILPLHDVVVTVRNSPSTNAGSHK